MRDYRRRAWRNTAPKRERRRAASKARRELGLVRRSEIGAVASGAYVVSADGDLMRVGPGADTMTALLTRERLMSVMRGAKRNLERYAPAPLPLPKGGRAPKRRARRPRLRPRPRLR